MQMVKGCRELSPRYRFQALDRKIKLLGGTPGLETEPVGELHKECTIAQGKSAEFIIVLPVGDSVVTDLVVDHIENAFRVQEICKYQVECVCRSVFDLAVAVCGEEELIVELH